MNMCCPACGRQLPRKHWPDLEFNSDALIVRRRETEVRLTRREAMFFEALYRRPDGFSDMKSLFDAVYVDDPNGGPLSMTPITAIYLGRLRDHLAPLGITVSTGRGSPKSGYRLIDLHRDREAQAC